MKQFYSSLIFNPNKFKTTHQVFRPRYNKEFFKRLSNNLELLISKRCPSCSVDIEQFKTDARKYTSLLTNRQGSDKDELLHELEDRIMPVVVAMPNRPSNKVCALEKDQIVDQTDSKFLENQKLFKVLSHTKLSYINNCFTKSVVGPNSHYYFGIGAKLHHSLEEFFTDELEKESFIQFSGLCLVKSAVVEGANHPSVKSYSNDPGRILSHEFKHTSLHLTEASRESLVGFITALDHVNSNDPLRLMVSGAAYRGASDWFEGPSNSNNITQYQTLHTLSMNPSIEQYSFKEYERNCDIIWNIYKKLKLRARLIQCSMNSLHPNEYDAHRIDVYLPSRREWIQSGRISHHLDYISVRVGMKRGHLIDSMVYDGQALMAAIIENFQTSSGKFMIPAVLQKYIMHLSESELKSYFQEASNIQLVKSTDQCINYWIPKHSINYEQRRFIARKTYFGHSKKAVTSSPNRTYSTTFMVTVVFLFIILVDWYSVWLELCPRFFKKLTFDGIYRPLRRTWWSIVYSSDTIRPRDETFDEYDKRIGNKKAIDFKFDEFKRHIPDTRFVKRRQMEERQDKE